MVRSSIRTTRIAIVLTLAVTFAFPALGSAQGSDPTAGVPAGEPQFPTGPALPPEIQKPPVPRRPWGQVRFGSLWLTPQVSIKEIGIDTNVFNSSAAEGPEADFMVTAGPQLDLQMAGKRIQIDGLVGADYFYFLENESERSLAFNGSVAASWQVTRRFALRGGGSDATSRERFSPEIDARAKHRTRSVSAGLALKMTRKLSLEVDGVISERRFDPGALYASVRLADPLNEDLRRSGARIGYSATPWTKLLIGGQASAYRFPFLPQRDADEERYTLGVTMEPRAIIAGTANVGYVLYTTRIAGTPDFEGVVAGGSLSTRLTENTVLQVLGGRDVALSYLPNVPWMLDERIVAVLRQTFFSRLELRLEAHDDHYSYLGFVPRFEGDQPLDDERVYRYIGGLIVRAAGDLRIGVISEYQQRITATPLRAYEGFRFYTSITYGRFSVRERGAPVPLP